MFRILVQIGLISSFFNLIAQSSPNTSVALPQAKESKKIVFKEDGQDHFMFNLTIDNVMNKTTNDSFFKSSVFNPNIGFYFLYDIPIPNTQLSFAPGLGFTFSKVGLDSSILTQNSQGTTFINSTQHPFFITGSNYTYGGSSFYTSWIEVPVELRYRSKPINGRSRIKVAVGLRAGVNLASNSKLSYTDNTIQREVNMKLSPFKDFASFRYGATFRIGYGALNLFGYYGLNQLIKDNKNYNNLDLRQYSIGVSITGM